MESSGLLAFLSGPEEIVQAYRSQYDPLLVFISILIAILSSWVSFQMAARLSERGFSPSGGLLWHSFGALSLGVGIWAMHFIGMLAFKLDCGVYYNPAITFLSLLPGVMAAGVALKLINRPTLTRSHLFFGGLIMGGGIGTMHYTGMAAMRLNGILRYDLPLFLISIVVAVLLAILALSIRLLVRRTQWGWSDQAQTLASAVVMGSAISGMHYIAMEAAYFLPGGGQHSIAPSNPAMLAWGVALATSLIILLAMASTFVKRQLDASQIRFQAIIEHMSQGFARLDSQGVIIDANPALHTILGAQADALQGQLFTELVLGRTAKEHFLSLLDSQQSITYDANLISSAGKATPCELHLEVRQFAVDCDLLRFVTATPRTRLTCILGALREGICAMDLEGRVEVLNTEAERLLGRKENDLMGRMILERFCHPYHTAQAFHIEEIMQQAHSQPVSFEELKLSPYEGAPIPVDFTLSLMSVAGQGAGFVLVFKDISDQLAMQRQIKELQAQCASKAKAAQD
ncbi:MHYT domain-containing protein [Magnetofaba australis]|uniref:Putative PAS/PAC sensor-containing diguanylate cyclase n=1 Tax=Magnetofaba australis IT-1 TaxID=1434232 RepID=A0A1Y2K0L6_9PROT|nr:MHYT domain-containing protein [Magnetofaba australis]OSM01502.1 putative PAS/PAC sensor-containing diguanylate cyclase [Magnetofaba australis IT-1]